MEQAASKEGELLPLYFLDSPWVRRYTGSTAAGMRAELTTASGAEHGNGSASAEKTDEAASWHGKSSQELGVGPAGCERDVGLPQASP